MKKLFVDSKNIYIRAQSFLLDQGQIFFVLSFYIIEQGLRFDDIRDPPYSICLLDISG